MKKKRNHFVPRVLLNRFYSWRDIKKKKFKTWCYQANGQVKEISTRDIALEKYFYGREDSILEDRLSSIESNLGNVLRDFDEKSSIKDHQEFLSQYALIQSFRTKAFRGVATETLKELLIARAQKTNTENARKHFLENGRIEIQKLLSGLTEDQRLYLKAQLGGISAEQFAELYLQHAINSGALGEQLRVLINEAVHQGVIDDGLAQGHNKALFEISEDITRSTVFKDCEWIPVHSANDEFVLGDAGIFIIDKEGNYRSMADFQNWAFVCFPIDPCTCLFGSRAVGG